MLLLPAPAAASLFPAGLYQGTPVSIITTLMGMPNMDFVVREARAVVDGQMAIIRLGTCGALRPPAQLGSFMVASPGAVCVRCVELAVRCQLDRLCLFVLALWFMDMVCCSSCDSVWQSQICVPQRQQREWS
jgi:hypothetical protein